MFHLFFVFKKLGWSQVKCVTTENHLKTRLCRFIEACVFSCRHGLARSGTEYGPLTDLPDWSFAGIYIFYREK